MKALLKELQDTWGYTQEELDHIQELMEDFGKSCYDVGYTDACKDKEAEKAYHAGFSYNN